MTTWKFTSRSLLILALTFGVSTSAESQVTAIRGGRIVDAETGRVAVNQVILIEGQDIKAVSSNVAIPDGATVSDLSREHVSGGGGVRS